VALFGATAGVFWQAGAFQFVVLDDAGYVSANPHVRAGLTLEGLRWAFTTTAMGNWHPLTWLSLMLDVQLFGVRAGALHAVNAALHALNGVLLFLLLERFTGAPWRSAFVAGVFCLHPLHVESVAWISERKDVLSGLFWISATWMYGRWATRGSRRAWVAALLLMALGLMAKPMLVTLPAALLLFDVWPLGRLRWDQVLRPSEVWPFVREKLPFFALSAASAIVTVLAQAAPGVIRISLGERAMQAVVSYARYIGKAAWPANLSVLYPDPVSPPLWVLAGSLLLLAAITAAAVRVHRRAPWALAAWLFYLGVLLPMIGLVPIGDQPFLPPDRYMYLPLIGLSVGVAWAACEWAGDGPRARLGLGLAAGLALLALATASHRQTSLWRDSASLFAHVHASMAPAPTPVVERLYGLALMQKGALEPAIARLRASARGERGSWKAHYWLAEALERAGRLDEAIAAYRRALAILPSHTAGWNRLGRALVNAGDLPAARQVFDRTIAARPGHPAAWESRAIVAEFEGQPAVAARHYAQALRIQPGLAYSRRRLGWIRATASDASLRDGAEALRLWQSVCASGRCASADDLDGLAAAQAATGRFEQATSTAEQAARAARVAGAERRAQLSERRGQEYAAGRALSVP